MSKTLCQDHLFNTANPKLLAQSEKIVTESESLGKGLPIQILDEFKAVQQKINCYYLLKLQSKHIHTQSIDDVFLPKPIFSKNSDIYGNQKSIFLYIQLQEFLKDHHQIDSTIYQNQTFAMIEESLHLQALFEPREKIKGSLTIPDCHTVQQKMLGTLELFYTYGLEAKIADLIMFDYLFSQALPSYGVWYISKVLYQNSMELEKFAQDIERGYLTGFQEFMFTIAQTEIQTVDSYLRLPYLYEKLMHYIEYTRSPYYQDTPLPKHTAILTKELLLRGEIKRGEVKHIIDKEQRTATNLISELLRQDYITTDSPKGAIRLKFNLQMATFVFPKVLRK
ncbi:MAG: hypothetical protein U9N49_02495 [Campylobacterota bacterium]|nr:hypothetical protein [Campylobacterota bacterium]